MSKHENGSARKRNYQRVLAVVIIACLVWGIVPFVALSAADKDIALSGESVPLPQGTVSGDVQSLPLQALSPLDSIPSYSKAFQTIADVDTSLNIFPATPENNGRIWTDKSVRVGTGADADTFAVTLSAMAQAVQTEKVQSVPSDTVFVLDVSFSMTDRLDTGESRVAVMIDALNDAIRTLMRENPLNRIAVVAFGGGQAKATSRVVPILTLGRYDEVTDGNYFSMRGAAYIKVNSNIEVPKLASPEARETRVLGGTSTQSGIHTGAQILLNEPETTYTADDGTQVIRTPNIVLLTDGEPTFGWDDYTFAESVSTTETGYSSANGNDVDMGPAILTVFTASYFKQQISEKYYGSNSTKTAGFYTIGLGMSDSDNARATLNPAGVQEGAESDGINASKISQSFKSGGTTTVYNMADVLDSFIHTGTTTFPTLQFREASRRDLITVKNPADPQTDKAIKTYNYADYYAEAETASELRDFFKDITQRIVSVGSYATSVIADPAGMYAQTHTSYADYSGAVVFSDVIGEYMEFKGINHLLFKGQPYNGAIFSHLIARENPNNTVPEIASAGITTTKLLDAMFASQLFFSNIASSGYSEDQVLTIIDSLLESCLEAGDGTNSGGEYGIYYKSATDFGNRIRFYATENGRWVANYFANGQVQYPNHADVPAEAVCIVDQYFVSSATHNSVSGNPSNLTYSIFEVITPLRDTSVGETNFSVTADDQIVPLPLPSRTLKEGQQMVRWTIPASLLPLRSVKSAEDVIDTEPIRFQYSVGLPDDFSLADVADDYSGIQDGHHYFYTNAWQENNNTAIAHFVPATDNAYYQSGRAEASVPSDNRTGTQAFATSGPNAENSVRYYALGNNGRMEVPQGTLTVTKTWDADMASPDVVEEAVLLLRNGAPVGEPKPATPTSGPGSTETVEWLDLPVYELISDGSGNAIPLAYTIQEGRGDTADSFDAHNVDGDFRIDYTQPSLNPDTNSWTAAIRNSPKNDKNWVVDLSKQFTSGETPLQPGEIQGATADFYLFASFSILLDSATTEIVYMPVLLGEWGEEAEDYENRPIRYPNDLASGQRSLWFAAADADPDFSFLVVEVPKSAPPGYRYADNPVSVAERTEIDLTDTFPLGAWVFDENGPTGEIGPFTFPDGIDGSDVHAYEVRNPAPNSTVNFAFTNHLVPVETPQVSLTFEKQVEGLRTTDPISSSFTVEGWDQESSAATRDITKRLYYHTFSLQDLITQNFSCGDVPPGYYTITETTPFHVPTDDGIRYDLAVTAASGDVPVTVNPNPTRNTATASFTLASGVGSAHIVLTNSYTPRAQLTIRKVFTPLLSPVPSDIAFRIADSTGKQVRFVSFDQFNEVQPDGNAWEYTVKDLPLGNYTVSEIAGATVNGYFPATVTVTPAGRGNTSGIITLQEGNPPQTVTFTNTYTPLPAGSLTIQKELIGFPEDWGIHSGSVFRARIKDVTDPSPEKHGYLAFNEKSQFTGQINSTGGTELIISENTPVTVLGLLADHRYRVEEVVPEGAAFTTQYESAGQVIDDITLGGTPVTVTVTNDYPHGRAGTLIVSKNLLGSYGDWGVTDSTPFRIRIYDEKAGNYLWFVEGNNSEEIQVNAASDSGIYWCVGNSEQGFSEAVERSKAVYTELPVTAGTPLVLQNLWADTAGWPYRIEEVLPPGAEGQYTNEGTVSVVLYDTSSPLATEGNTHASIRNLFQKNLGNLVIQKRLAGSPADWGVGNDIPFTLRIREAEGVQQYLTFDAENQYTGTDDTGTSVSFSGSSPVVFFGVPAGRYVIEEIVPPNSDHYAISYEGEGVSTGGETEVFDDGSITTATVVNIYEHATGRLILQKTLSGQYESWGANGTTVFRARIYEQVGSQENLLYFAPVGQGTNQYRCVGSSEEISDPAYEGVSVDNVNLFDTIPFRGDAPALLDELWIQNDGVITYRVEEVGGAYTVRYTNNEQSLPHDGTNTTGNVKVTAINTYRVRNETPPSPSPTPDVSPSPSPTPGGDVSPSPSPGGDPPLDPVPSTGDDSNNGLWQNLLLLSGLGTTGVLIWRRRRKPHKTQP